MKNSAPVSCRIGLDDQYCETVVTGALRFLSTRGIYTGSKIVKDYFSNYDGIKIDGDTVLFSENLLRQHLADIKEKSQPVKREKFIHGQPWSCLNYYDPSTRKVRPGTAEDLARVVRFMDSFGAPGNVPPVALSEYNPDIRDLHGTRVCFENSAIYGAPTHTPDARELPLYKAMARTAGRKVWILAMLIINPMKFDDKVLEFVIDNKDAPELDIEMVGGLPAIGSTSPLVFPAAHIQGLAEDLAAAFFMHTIQGNYPPPYLRGDPFDMQFTNYKIAGPEYVLLDLANRRLHEYITGQKRDWGYLLSMSKEPDQQAAHERTIGCWAQAMDGATFFKGSGQLSSDEVFSAEQVVIDRSIVKGAEHVCKGLKYDLDIERSLSIIDEGLKEGHYLMHDTTLEEYRDFFCTGGVFKGTNLGQWREKGERSILDEARDVVTETLAMNDFQLSDEQVKELRNICSSGGKIILGD